ncbi:M55 family metallopeptidase [bacterium]|nr:M55 family metallopeptidase [bacterium]
MKLFISTDMEGVMGVSSWTEMEPGQKGRECSQSVLRELSWVIDELKQSGINSQIEEILVCDSHSRGENVPFGLFEDERVKLIKGYPRPFYMMHGLDSSYSLALLIGYHAKAGSEKGVMDHTYASSCIYNIRINNNTVGEAEVNAYLAGVSDVPIGLISGDDILEKEMQAFFNPNIPFVRTKEGSGRFAAKMYSPSLIEKEYRKQVRLMLDSYKNLQCKKLEGKIELEIDMITSVMTDALAIVPGIERLNGRTVKYVSDDYRNIYRMIITAAMIGSKFVDYK